MSSNGGSLFFKSAYYPRGSVVRSGLVPVFSGRTPGYAQVCILPPTLCETLVSPLDSTVPPVLSLPGAVPRWMVVADVFSIWLLQAPLCLRSSVFLFTVPEFASKGTYSIVTRSNGRGSSGVLPPLSGSNCGSSADVGQTGPPDILRQPWRPLLLRQVSGLSPSGIPLNCLS